MRDGQEVRFTVDSYPNEIFQARVQQIRQAATQDASAVSYLVILDVDNPDGKLLTGMTANVDIIAGKRENVLRVPIAATRFLPRERDRANSDDDNGDADAEEDGDSEEDEPGAFVWVPGEEPYKPTRRAVTLGLSGEGFVEVTSGLEEGSTIIVRSREIRD